jgi:hypothetical protein
MKYLIKSVFEIEIEIEADSIEEANLKHTYDDEYQYKVYAVMNERGKDIDAQYVDQMIFPLDDAFDKMHQAHEATTNSQ